MTKTIPYLVLAAAFLMLYESANAQSISLRAGTLIQCTLYEPRFSSRTAQIGDPMLCYLRPLREFGQSVFPRGSYLVGRFADYQDPGHFVGKGWMKLEFDRLIISPTDEVPIAAKVVSVRRYRLDPEGKIIGRGHPKRDAFFWTIPILWPIKLMTLLARGPRPTISGEVPITLRLMDDVCIPLCVPQAGQTLGPQAEATKRVP